MSKKRGIPTEYIHHTKDGVIKIEGKFKLNTKTGKPSLIIYGGNLKKGRHIHTSIDHKGKLKAEITNEEKRRTDEEHIPLTKESFEENKN